MVTFGCILKVRPTEFHFGLDIRWERTCEVKSDFKIPAGTELPRTERR